MQLAFVFVKLSDSQWSFSSKELNFVCLIDDKKGFEKNSFKDVLLAWSGFSKKKKIIHQCSIPAPIESTYGEDKSRSDSSFSSFL